MRVVGSTVTTSTALKVLQWHHHGELHDALPNSFRLGSCCAQHSACQRRQAHMCRWAPHALTHTCKRPDCRKALFDLLPHDSCWSWLPGGQDGPGTLIGPMVTKSMQTTMSVNSQNNYFLNFICLVMTYSTEDAPYLIRNKNQPQDEALCPISPRTSGENDRSGPSWADVHDKTWVWETSGWYSFPILHRFDRSFRSLFSGKGDHWISQPLSSATSPSRSAGRNTRVSSVEQAWQLAMCCVKVRIVFSNAKNWVPIIIVLNAAGMGIYTRARHAC